MSSLLEQTRYSNTANVLRFLRGKRQLVHGVPEQKIPFDCFKPKHAIESPILCLLTFYRESTQHHCQMIVIQCFSSSVCPTFRLVFIFLLSRECLNHQSYHISADLGFFLLFAMIYTLFNWHQSL